MASELTGILSGTGAKMKGEILADHVRFRGAVQADVPFEEIVAEVRGTLLVLSFRGHIVELGAGAKANGLAAQLRNRPSRLDRLGVEYGMSAAVAGPVEAGLKSELSSRAVVAPGTPRAPVDLLFFAVENLAGLQPIQKLVALLAPAGSLWVLYPTGNTGVTEVQIVAACKNASLTKAGAFQVSPQQSALRFTRRS